LQEETAAPQSSDPTPAAPATKSGGDDNLIAAISYLWILSIIILLVKKDSDFVKFHARQGVVLFAASVLLMVVNFIPLVIFISWIGNLVILVAVIVGFIQALGGNRYKLPVVGDLAEKVKM